MVCVCREHKAHPTVHTGTRTPMPCNMPCRVTCHVGRVCVWMLCRRVLSLSRVPRTHPSRRTLRHLLARARPDRPCGAQSSLAVTVCTSVACFQGSQSVDPNDERRTDTHTTRRIRYGHEARGTRHPARTTARSSDETVVASSKCRSGKGCAVAPPAALRKC
jgi:hypothetical protein